MVNSVTFFILVAVLIVAVVGVLFLVFSGKNNTRLNVKKYQTQWLAVENSISRANESSWQVAIFNADKLVDQALRERHVKGKTMGERMKSAEKLWSHPNHIWGAHKIRNQLAHETTAKLSYELSLRALSAYKQALKDLGAI